MIGNKLEPFKFWCQKVLPNVYDDSLSYYEYLCKLNEYLNEVIAQINTLTDNMEDYEEDLTATWLETKEYIDNYFNNLDVQQEINNKLDQMAQSGALSTLLAPIVGTQIGGVVAQQIGDTVANQIDNVVAGQIDNVVAEQIDNAVVNPVNEWLEDNIEPTTPTIDASLTISGAGADSAVTGNISRFSAKIFEKALKIEPYETVEDKALRDNGTITNVSGCSYSKYKISDTDTIILNGKLEFATVYSVLWFITNGVMTDTLTVRSNPDYYRYETISIPNNTDEIWVSKDPANSMNVIKYDDTIIKTMLSMVDTFIEPNLNSYQSGFMRSDGSITTVVSGGKIEKFKNDGYAQIRLNGTGTLSVTAYTYIRFYHEGTIIGHIDATSNPQIFNNTVYDIPENTDEIWVQNYLPSAYLNKIEFSKYSQELLIKAYNKLEKQNHWCGKKWYGYGTSITNTGHQGRYPTYLALMSGLDFTNKGISGGGIGDLGAYSRGQVYNAICNITDGKLEADLITLETGANDTGADVPLGTIYDTGQSTLAGCLNDCLRYLQTNTNAQIAVTVSPVLSNTAPNATDKYYEWAEMVEQICKINRVHFMNGNNNMGYAKLSSSDYGSLYVVDQIHQTNLGGYIMADNLWAQLKDIPLFYNAIPD